jgi:glycosyltransferase involved in cell wall biosynthesis
MNFSILITTYNQEKYLLRCINSCITQNYKKNFEVIVCDTSLKSNYHIVKHFNKKNFHYFHKKKFSDDGIMDQTFKNYFMFKKSKGKVVCFLDGDDLFFKNKLRSISKIITNNSVNHDKPIYFFEKNKKKKKISNIFFKKKFIL